MSVSEEVRGIQFLAPKGALVEGILDLRVPMCLLSVTLCVLALLELSRGSQMVATRTRLS